MKTLFVAILLATMSAFAEVSPIEAEYVCMNQFQKGFAFNSQTKRAWQVDGSHSRNGIELSIFPEDFEIYRCPGCFSFKGFIEAKGEMRQVYAFTHMNTLHHILWMFYLTQDSSGEMIQETIPCREL